MARCVLIIDSATGKVIDVAGNVREGGRYRKFVGRMMSADENPVLDYGVNGGDKLEISKGGYAGEEVNIKAKSVNVSGNLTVNGKSINDIIFSPGYVKKSDIADVIEGLSASAEDPVEDLGETLGTLIDRLSDLASSSEGEDEPEDTYVRDPDSGKYYKIIVVMDEDGRPTLDLSERGVDAI